MKQYLSTWSYEHETYLDDVRRKEKYKEELIQLVDNAKLSFFKRRRVKKLVGELCELQFLLNESEQRELMLNEEIWGTDGLEYNVNQVYEYIVQNAVEKQKVDTPILYEYCNVENELDIKYIKMNDTLRRSKEDNPIIILVNDMFVKPFIINGNHRIMKAYRSGIEKVDAYILNADWVVHCLISEDYKTAYKIFQDLHGIVGLQLNS